MQDIRQVQFLHARPSSKGATMIRYRARYGGEFGIQYKCIIVTKEGSTRKSGWHDSRIQAFSKAMFWAKYHPSSKTKA